MLAPDDDQWHALMRHLDGVRVPELAIRRQLRHYADLGITSVDLRGATTPEIVHAVHGRSAPMILARNGLKLTFF